MFSFVTSRNFYENFRKSSTKATWFKKFLIMVIVWAYSAKGGGRFPKSPNKKSIITLEKKWRGRFNNLHPTTVRSSKKIAYETFWNCTFLDFMVRADNLENNQKKNPEKLQNRSRIYNMYLIWLGGLLWWKKFTIYCTCGKRSKSKAWSERHENQFLFFNFFLTTTQCLNMEAISILLDFHFIF